MKKSRNICGLYPFPYGRGLSPRLRIKIYERKRAAVPTNKEERVSGVPMNKSGTEAKRKGLRSRRIRSNDRAKRGKGAGARR